MTTAAVRSELLCAWRGPSLLVVDPRGDCSDHTPLSGFYYRETRFLRTLRLDVNGTSPWLCESASVSPTHLAFAYAHPEVARFGGGGTGQSGDDVPRDERGLELRSIDLRLDYRMRAAGVDLHLAVANRSLDAVSLRVVLQCDADFADIQESIAPEREQQAPISSSVSGHELRFVYEHPRLRYWTTVTLPDGWSGSGKEAAAQVRLAPRERLEWHIAITPGGAHTGFVPDDLADRTAAVERWQARMARIDAPGNRLFERVVGSNVRDIVSFPLLDGSPDEWLALQAGMPMYPAFFGRDALTAGWQAAMLDGGESLDAALTRLGRLQSDRDDEWRDEEPGRIPYQVRSGPLALLDLNPYSAYYADFASPLMYVIALANRYAWQGDRDTVRRHWDTARRIMDWARDRGDADRDGYLEYRTRSSRGTKNQGWKDSGDAIVYPDGRPVPPPIATCELQGYWFAAQTLMGLLAAAMGDMAESRAYAASAGDLKQRFNRDWWLEADGFFALALDPDKRPVAAPSSNVGHCLACGIVDRSRIPATVGRMFAPDLFSGWGIRTLSTDHQYYSPISYHRGSVWAVEQATIAFGLRRFGFDARAIDLAEGLFSLSQIYAEFRIPECVGGYARGTHPTPGAYPRANTPQLWNATAFPLIVQTLLGLLPLAPARTLVIDPVLPSWLPEIIVHDLRVGSARATLRCWRDAGRTRWEAVRTSGALRIVRQPPPESLSASAGDRIEGLLDSLTH